MNGLLASLTVLAQAAGTGYDNPNEWGYVAAGWGVIILGLVVYAALIIRKGRQLARQVPPEDRRWMS